MANCDRTPEDAMSRRLQPALLALASVVALGAFVVLLAGFVWPDPETDINLGPAEAFPRGSVTSFYLPHGSAERRVLRWVRRDGDPPRPR